MAIGVVSAAILTDEPFDLHEAAGAFLIIIASIVEVLQRKPATAAGAEAPSATRT